MKKDKQVEQVFDTCIATRKEIQRLHNELLNGADMKFISVGLAAVGRHAKLIDQELEVARRHGKRLLKGTEPYFPGV